MKILHYILKKTYHEFHRVMPKNRFDILWNYKGKKRWLYGIEKTEEPTFLVTLIRPLKKKKIIIPRYVESIADIPYLIREEY